MQTPEANFNFIPAMPPEQPQPQQPEKQPEPSLWQTLLKLIVALVTIAVIMFICIIALGYSAGWAIKAVNWAIYQWSQL